MDDALNELEEVDVTTRAATRRVTLDAYPDLAVLPSVTWIGQKPSGSNRYGSYVDDSGARVGIFLAGKQYCAFFSPGCEPTVIGHRWTFSNGYVATQINGKKVYFHQLIFPAPAGFEIDHINQCKLDNRLENLRHTTHAMNCRNQPLRVTSITGIPGVTYTPAQTLEYWTVYYAYGRGRRNQQRFPIATLGDTGARQAAEQWKSVHQQGDDPALRYNTYPHSMERAARYVGAWRDSNGDARAASFSVAKFGEYGALLNAIAARKKGESENGYLGDDATREAAIQTRRVEVANAKHA